MCEKTFHGFFFSVRIEAFELGGLIFFFQDNAEYNDWDEDGEQDPNYDDCDYSRFAKTALSSLLAFFWGSRAFGIIRCRCTGGQDIVLLEFLVF